MLNLTECKIGKKYSIVCFDDACPQKIKRRLLDLGFIENQMICICKKSLSGKVFLLEIRGYLLSIQSKIAKYILVGG